MRSVEHGGLQAGKPTPNLTCDCRYRFWRRVNIPVAIQACCRRAVGSAAVSCLDQVLVCHNMTIYLLIVTWQVLGCSSVVTNMHPFHRGCAHFARPEAGGRARRQRSHANEARCVSLSWRYNHFKGLGPERAVSPRDSACNWTENYFKRRFYDGINCYRSRHS